MEWLTFIAAIVGVIVLWAILKKLLATKYKFNRAVIMITVGLALTVIVSVLLFAGEMSNKEYATSIGIVVGVLNTVALYCYFIFGVNYKEYDWENWDGSFEYNSSSNTFSPTVKKKDAGLLLLALFISAVFDVVLPLLVSKLFSIVISAYFLITSVVIWMRIRKGKRNA